MIYAITSAFCPVAQLARTLIEHNSYGQIHRHIVVNCHYPINYEKNQSDLKIFMDSFTNQFPKTELWDPGSDLGSAQSQNWALDNLAHELTDDDYFINLDPDAACRKDWIWAASQCLDADPRLVVVSCNAPMVEDFINRRHQSMAETELAGYKLMLPDIPTPFNLSMWRYSFIRQIGGIPQLFPHYGEVEGPIYMTARAHGYYNAYLKDFMENEDGKLMHDRAFEDWKDAHARQHTFLGNFKEYCEQNNLL